MEGGHVRMTLTKERGAHSRPKHARHPENASILSRPCEQWSMPPQRDGVAFRDADAESRDDVWAGIALAAFIAAMFYMPGLVG